MESSADEIGALCETVVFLSYFKDLPDARQSGKVKYPLDEILLLCLLAIVAGAETITDIARFGRLKLALLRRFRPFEDGRRRTITSATFWRPWTPKPSSVALSPGSRRKRGFRPKSSPSTAKPEPVRFEDFEEEEGSQGSDGYRVGFRRATAFLVLGQVKVAGENRDEIIAIPKLLGMLKIEGAVVTIDAMGCQRDIAQTILDKKADYILALKGNQGTLKDDVKLFVDEQKAVDFKDAKVSRDKTVDA